MTKITAFIIEDEKHNRDLLHGLLEKHFPGSVEVIGSSGSILASIEFLKNRDADILFLDIELSDGQVFDLFSRIDYRKYKLIFTTGYSEHAIKAIRFSAVDYLLKPIVARELVEAVNKALESARGENPVLQDFINRREFGISDHLIINTQSSIEKIALENISHLEADGIYTEIFHSRKKTVSSKPLGVYEDVLPPGTFIRCHKSFIVNKYFIKKISKGRSLQLLLQDGTQIPVAVRKKEEFNQWFRA